jgi:arylsulfatase A-like enzyme
MKGRISSFVETVDVAATIMDFVNENTATVNNIVSVLNPSPNQLPMQGKSLLPLMRGKVDKVREFAITGYFNFSWSIVSKDWSYVQWLDSKENADRRKMSATVGLARMEEDEEIWTCAPGTAPETPFKNELYDRRNDPFQLNNLIDSSPGTADELSKTLMDYMLGLRAEG